MKTEEQLIEEYQKACSGGFRMPSKDIGFELFCKNKSLEEANEALKEALEDIRLHALSWDNPQYVRMASDALAQFAPDSNEREG